MVGKGINRRPSKTRQKRKAYLSAKKASKKKAHKKDDSDDEESVGYRKEKALKDEVKFGQVVQQPPSISVVPKLRGPAAKAAATEKLRQLELAKDEDRTDEKKKMRETNETDNFEKVGRKRKLRDLPEYERQLVLSERENAIALYRAAKSKKVRVSERECGDDDEMDDE
ncbi:hypothetical protein BC832DRAFT_308648 [Gaertneriomyces semiglobifer]|nr:hypothetical protein BC832DRAFT_308648 [Gaertneriomyces semiglobifer]